MDGRVGVEQARAELVLERAETVIRRMVPAREAQDLVQEAALRALAGGSDLPDEELAAYTARTARNLAIDWYRKAERQRRLEPGIIDLRTPDQPDDRVIARLEAQALRTASARLGDDEIRMLRRHHVDDADLHSIAVGAGRTPMAVRLSLARSRARLRLAYLLESQRVNLPTDRCEAVLLAVASGDRRAQARTDAGTHLAGCSPCAELTSQLGAHRRPVIAAIPVLGGLIGWLRPRAGQVAGAVGATAAVTAAVVVMAHRGPDQHEAQAVSTTTQVTPTTGRLMAGDDAVRGEPSSLRVAVKTVRADGVLVAAVPADEGFWVETDEGGRVWVQLTTDAESSARIEPGSRLDFRGILVAHDPGYAAQVGVTADEGAKRLDGQGAHIEVDPTALRSG